MKLKFRGGLGLGEGGHKTPNLETHKHTYEGLMDILRAGIPERILYFLKRKSIKLDVPSSK